MCCSRRLRENSGGMYRRCYFMFLNHLRATFPGRLMSVFSLALRIEGRTMPKSIDCVKHGTVLLPILLLHYARTRQYKILLYIYAQHLTTTTTRRGFELPCVVIKPTKRCVRILNVLLRLLPHVEDGTVFTRAQDILRAAQCLASKGE